MQKKLLWRELCGTCEWWEETKQHVGEESSREAKDEDELEKDDFGICANNLSEYFKLYLSESHFKCPEYERAMRFHFKKPNE